MAQAKLGEYPHATKSARTVAYQGCDASLKICGSEASCVDATTQSSFHQGRGMVKEKIDHNLGCHLDDSRGVRCIGGLLSPPTVAATILGARSKVELVAQGVSELGTGFNSSVPGCIELRTHRGRCEFDGRFSLASLRGRLLLYSRANMNPKGGGRYVTVSVLEDDGASSPMEPIRFLGRDSLGAKAGAARSDGFESRPFNTVARFEAITDVTGPQGFESTFEER